MVCIANGGSKSPGSLCRRAMVVVVVMVVVAVAAECVDKVRAGGAEYRYSGIYPGDRIKHSKERDGGGGEGDGGE